MCSFITLIVQGDAAGVADVLKRHGRKATPFDNPSIRRMLRPGEAAFLTTAGHCDCGTVLAARAPKQPDHEDEANRLRKKGWSQAKIGRAMHDRKKAEERPGPSPVDSLPFRAAVVSDVAGQKSVTGVGLMVRSYSGDLSAEEFAVSRREACSDAIEAELIGLRENELLFFGR